MFNFKEKLSESLGALGIILFWLVRVAISVLPFVMIDVNFFWTFVLLIVNSLVPLATVVFWAWGLVAAILGKQDIFAIIYYIVFAVCWLPFYVNLIISTIASMRRRK